MPGIVVKENEPLNEAMRRFKKELIEEGILEEIKKRLYYKSASELRHEKLAPELRRRKRRRRRERKYKKVSLFL